MLGRAEVRVWGCRAATKAEQANAVIDYREGLADAVPCEDASIDVATATLLLHHLRPDLKDQALRELHRVRRPGGRLVIADWGRPHDPLTRASFLCCS
ncbi:MAG: class I SAM-dependent methyltransferase [Solirubrobacteraceae bacterium]